MPDNIPIPPGLVREVARKCHETMCDAADVSLVGGVTPSWDAMPEEFKDAWDSVGREAIATTLETMRREGWITVHKPGAARGVSP